MAFRSLALVLASARAAFLGPEAYDVSFREYNISTSTISLQLYLLITMTMKYKYPLPPSSHHSDSYPV